MRTPNKVTTPTDSFSSEGMERKAAEYTEIKLCPSEEWIRCNWPFGISGKIYGRAVERRCDIYTVRDSISIDSAPRRPIHN